MILNFQDSLSRQEFFFVYFGFPLDWLHNIIRLLFCQYFLQLILFIFHYFILTVELSDFSLFILMFAQYYTFSNRMLLLTSYACACSIVNQASFYSWHSILFILYFCYIFDIKLKERSSAMSYGRQLPLWTTQQIAQQRKSFPPANWFWLLWWLRSPVSSLLWRFRFRSARYRSVLPTWWSWSVSMYLVLEMQPSVTSYICYLVLSVSLYFPVLPVD